MKAKAYLHIFILAIAAGAYFFLGAFIVDVLSPWIAELADSLKVILHQIFIPFFLVVPFLYLLVAKLDQQTLQAKGPLSAKQVIKTSIIVNGLGMFIFLVPMMVWMAYFIRQGLDFPLLPSNTQSPPLFSSFDSISHQSYR